MVKKYFSYGGFTEFFWTRPQLTRGSILQDRRILEHFALQRVTVSIFQRREMTVQELM